MRNKGFLVVIIFGVVFLMFSCRKDYQKLAIEFERSLPDTMEILKEQINDIDHFVYYKNRNNTELLRYNIDSKVTESVLPEMKEHESIYGIYAGEENIAVLKHQEGSSSTFLTYNLKTMKFKQIEWFWGAEIIDAIVSESDKTITGYLGLRGGPTKKCVYDFDGNKLSEEEEEEPIGDLDVPNMKYWQCIYCGLVIKSSTEPQEKQNDCPKREHSYLMYTPHVWKAIGNAY